MSESRRTKPRSTQSKSRYEERRVILVVLSYSPVGVEGLVADDVVGVASGFGVPARRRLLSCLRCLVTKALMTFAATGAEASAPQPPCSHSTATTMSGLRRGAMPTNQALARALPVPRLVVPALWFTTSAVPVLPAKSMPSRWTAAAVPVVVVAAMASVMVSQLAGVRGMRRSPD